MSDRDWDWETYDAAVAAGMPRLHGDYTKEHKRALDESIQRMYDHLGIKMEDDREDQ